MLWEFALVIFLLVFTVFIILLIFPALELRKTLKKISNLIDNLNKDLPSILDNINKVSESAISASGKIQNAVGDVVEFEQKISNEIKQPVLEATTTIAAILRGMQAFVTYFLQKRNK